VGLLSLSSRRTKESDIAPLFDAAGETLDLAF